MPQADEVDDVGTVFELELPPELQPQHEDRAEDAGRDEWLRGQDFRVLRFPNQQIENHGEQVVSAILAAADERLTKG